MGVWIAYLLGIFTGVMSVAAIIMWPKPLSKSIGKQRCSSFYAEYMRLQRMKELEQNPRRSGGRRER